MALGALPNMFPTQSSPFHLGSVFYKLMETPEGEGEAVYRKMVGSQKTVDGIFSGEFCCMFADYSMAHLVLIAVTVESLCKIE